MLNSSLIPWLDPQYIIEAAGPWALMVVFFIIFAEVGLLAGFILPGDTLLVISGLLTHTSQVFGVGIFVVGFIIAIAAFLGGEVGYFIGHKTGPKIFERKETGLFSIKNVERTNAFFAQYGALSIVLARFVPVIRTFIPVAAGVAHMQHKKYTLYNAVGAIIWGVGLTYAGYLLGYIPPLANLVSDYIDLILLAAVLVTIIPTVFHYIVAVRKKPSAKSSNEDTKS